MDLKGLKYSDQVATLAMLMPNQLYQNRFGILLAGLPIMASFEVQTLDVDEVLQCPIRVNNC
ncbi:hypothetical protein PEC18_30360 [Paucibacter sp. O1-1]|nr:hypothetical protein [Paucibacter sp. O1-1]MDA3830018.1 hypothetical protein [Paucibacter sp. O1-1]